MLRIRVATEDDVPVLLALARAFYDEDGFTTSDDELARNFRVLLQSDNAHIAVAVLDDIDAGFALTTTAFILESGIVAELQDLYVAPHARRGGVGSALIADAVEWARSQAATQVQVVIAPNGQDVAQLFGYYRARGFVDQGRRLMVHNVV